MIKILKTVAEIQQYRKQNIDKTISLIPTMGNLHDGHLELAKIGKQHSDLSMVSIFVNPTQFGINEDLSNYPRTFKEDLAKLEEVGVDAIFYPEISSIYPFGEDKSVIINMCPDIMDILCSKDRPTHFQGVATVVTKLFTIINPDIAVFGKKDYQQQVIIKRLVNELFLDVKIITGDIVREKSGLAMSSRNQYLTEKEKELVPRINQTLHSIREALLNGLEPKKVINNAIESINSLGLKVEYLELRDRDDLHLTESLSNAVLLTVVRAGKARLLDNIEI